MYKVIIDSSGELPVELQGDSRFCNVPLVLDVDGEQITDDETFNQLEFLDKVAKSPVGPKSACPSPERYMQAFDKDAERIYLITLSGELSGSYNSAVLAKEIYEEEHEDEGKQIYVFNSRSASIGETLVGLKIKELEEEGMSFEDIVENVEKYIDSMHTFFVLETLETFRKTGRLSGAKAMVVNTLNIKPVMGSTDEGGITQVSQGRGMKKALMSMINNMIDKTADTETKTLAISHCNCPERAEFVKKHIEAVAKFKDIVIVNMAGVSSMYANDGGVILAV